VNLVTESGLFQSDTPLCPVSADDLKRVWGLIRRVIADHGPGVGIDERMISQQCGPGADVHAAIGARGMNPPHSFSKSAQPSPRSRVSRDLITHSSSLRLRSEEQ
jgi:hypothetical protein